MTDDRIHLVQDGGLAATVDAWLDPAVEADVPALARFFRGAEALAPHWGALAKGVPGPTGRLVTFTLGPEHVPEGLDAVRRWLRAQPCVRLVEVERHPARPPRAI